MISNLTLISFPQSTYDQIISILWFFLVRWLDSSKTLYEQDVKEHDLLYLRFKYYSFMDIDPRVSRFMIPHEMVKAHSAYLCGPLSK